MPTEQTTEIKELTEALGTLLDLIQLTRILDKAQLSQNDMRDFIRAKRIHSKYALAKWGR